MRVINNRNITKETKMNNDNDSSWKFEQVKAIITRHKSKKNK